MNQILFSEINENQKQVNTKTDINTVIRFFCVFIIIFGIALVSTGAYFFIQNRNKVNGVDTSIKPEIQVQKIDEKTLTAVVNHNQPILYLQYNWNEETSEKINENGKKDIQQTIEIIPGNNVLHILVEDASGNQGIYEQEYSYVVEGDIEKPKIAMTPVGNYIEITGTDETEMDYITYKWNEEEAITIKPSVEKAKIVSTKVEVRKGENLLQVEAFDKNGNSWTEEKKYKGVTRPVINFGKSGNNILITVDDEEGIKYIDIDLNEQRLRIQLNEIRKQIQYTLAMEPGMNILKVVAYSVNGESTTLEGKAESSL